MTDPETNSERFNNNNMMTEFNLMTESISDSTNEKLEHVQTKWRAFIDSMTIRYESFNIRDSSTWL